MAFDIPVPLVAALSGALAGGASAWLLETLRRTREMRALVNALFAELRHMREHYFYAAVELPRGRALGDIRAVRRALLWSRFEGVHSAHDFQKFGFLDAQHVQQLLQISFRVRNTDTDISLLLEEPDLIGAVDIEELRARMQDISRSAQTLMRIVQKRKRSLRKYKEAELILTP